MTYLAELELEHLQANYFAKVDRFSPWLKMRTRFPKERADLGAVSKWLGIVPIEKLLENTAS